MRSQTTPRESPDACVVPPIRNTLLLPGRRSDTVCRDTRSRLCDPLRTRLLRVFRPAAVKARWKRSTSLDGVQSTRSSGPVVALALERQWFVGARFLDGRTIWNGRLELVEDRSELGYVGQVQWEEASTSDWPTIPRCAPACSRTNGSTRQSRTSVRLTNWSGTKISKARSNAARLG